MTFSENIFEKLLLARTEQECENILDRECEKCASRNILHCNCDGCEVEGAYKVKVENIKLFNQLIKV